MKRILLLICTLLCANVLLAQTEFMVGELLYQVTNPNEVKVKDCLPIATSIIIPTTVSNSGTTYSVTSIESSAFRNCSSLTSVNIGNSVTSIGNLAFMDCSSLTSVTIPNSVTSIGGSAFGGCSSLTSVTIPNSVTSIGSSAFSGCSSLTSITIPNSVTSIGCGVFYNCSSLTSVTLSNNIIELPTCYGSLGFKHGFFEGCSSLTSIDIPNSVTSIGEIAFYNCSSLTSVNIGESVTSIGGSAFVNCSSLTSVNIGNSVTSIGDSAFYGCSSLTSVTIPNSVTEIGSRTFYNCSSLNTLNFNAINCNDFYNLSPFFDCPITTINIGDSVQRIPEYFAYHLSSLTSVTIGNSVTSIGDLAFRDCSITTLNFNARNCNDFNYSNYYPYEYPPFYYCTITTINIGNSVERIPDCFVIDSDSLTSVTIGNSVTSIGHRAFEDCSSLDTVTCLATTPPTTLSSFYSIPSNTKLIVYCGLKNYYATVWSSNFAYDNIYEIPFAIDVNVNNEVGGNVTIENNCSTATLTATANDCYQFVSWNDGNTENPRIVYLTSDTSLTAIFENLNTELSATICEGSVYNENGFNVSEAGVYTQTLTSVNGCDSIVTLTLNVNPIFNTELSANICEGSVYTENGFNVSEAGVYTQTLTSVNGCDSIVTLTVSVNPTFDTTINATINPGETYAEFGFNESEAGTYVQNLQTVNGCDSTITLVLSVNSSLLDIEETEISLYPNPTDSKITFSSTIESIEVIDQAGRCVLTFTNAREINIESLPAGAYYLRLTNNDKAIMQKVIKE